MNGREKAWGGFAVRIILPVAATLALVLAAFFFFLIPEFERRFRNQHSDALRQLVAGAVRGLGAFRAAEEAGRHTREEAQHEALEYVRALRHGADAENTFYVVDGGAVLLAYPSRPELEGIVITEYSALAILGRSQAEESLREHGQAYVEYEWPSERDPGKSVRKLAYVVNFEPWDWIVGTSVQTGEIDREVAAFSRKVVIIALVILLFAAALLWHVITQRLKMEVKRRAAEDALRQSELRFRELAELLPDIVYEMNEEGTLTFVNKQAYAMTGYSREDFAKGLKAISFLAPEDRRRAAGNIGRIMRGEDIGVSEYTALRKDGSSFPVITRSMPIIRDGKPAGLRGMMVDVTEQKKAQAALEESEENYRTIFECANDAILIHDMHTGEILDVNRSMTEMFGYTADEAKALSIGEISRGTAPYSQADAVEWVRKAAQKGPQVFEWHCRARRGRLFWTEVSLKRVTIGGQDRVVALVRGIDERKRLEENLRQAQKMEAVGQLAGGIAHDFNNILTALGGYAEKALQETGSPEAANKNVAAIRDSIERAAALTRRLLAFSRRQPLEKRLVSLNSIIEGSEELIRQLVGGKIELILSLADDIPLIEADAHQVEQVLINLAMNARDAMPDGGRLLIESARVQLPGEIAGPASGVAPGDYAMITVTDEGIGMDESTLSHVFEPFYTTKGPEVGTGLGLSMVYGVVKQHGGCVDVSSVPGIGTTFAVFLPICVKDTPIAEGTAPPQGQSSKGAPTVLVVEDNELVRPLTCQALRESGYNVVEAANPSEAVARCSEYESKIDLLLTDVVLPEMNAADLVERLLRMRSEMRVLYVSGHSCDDLPVRQCIGSNGLFLQKPFTIDALTAKVREALNEPAAAAKTAEG